MSYLIHYIIALTFSLLGLQLKKPVEVKNIPSFFKITEMLPLDTSKEKDSIPYKMEHKETKSTE